MDVKYQLTKVILIGMFWSLQTVLPVSWAFFACGITLPFLDLFIAKDRYLASFPWELYLFYLYAFAGIFIDIDTELLSLGFGYALSRMTIYFQVR